MKKLYERLLMIFVISTILTSVLFVVSLYSRGKKENYHYLEQLLSGVETNLRSQQKDYEEKLQILGEDYLNRAMAVEYILSSASQMISSQEFAIVKELMEVGGIAVTDQEGKVCLAAGEQSDPKEGTGEAVWSGARVVIEQTGFKDIPSYFYVELETDLPQYASIRLDAQVNRLGLMSQQNLVENTLAQATTEEDTLLAAIAKENGQIAGITRNNSQKIEIQGIHTDTEFLGFLEEAEEKELLILKINGEYHTALVREQEGVYFFAATRMAGIFSNVGRTIGAGTAGIAILGLLTLSVVHFHLKKYLFSQVEEMKGEIHRVLKGDFAVQTQERTQKRLPEFQSLAEAVHRLRQGYIKKSEGISRMEDQLSLARTEARFDYLTGLYNRNGFVHCTELFLEKEHPSGVLILFDMDNFKRINDSEGHPEGDRILVRFAECLRASFRKSDYIGRLGGDEFVVLMPNTVGMELLEQKFQVLLENVRTALGVHYEMYQVSVSIGAVPIDGGIKSYEGLYRCADTALYIAKFLGKDQYYINSKKISCMKRECMGCRKDCPRSKILKKKNGKEME